MDEILNLIESVSEGFPTYSWWVNSCCHIRIFYHCYTFQLSLNSCTPQGLYIAVLERQIALLPLVIINKSLHIKYSMFIVNNG